MYYRSECKDCYKPIQAKYNEQKKWQRDKEQHQAYRRAYSKASVRLKNLMPEMFEELMVREMYDEGYERRPGKNNWVRIVPRE